MQERLISNELVSLGSQSIAFEENCSLRVEFCSEKFCASKKYSMIHVFAKEETQERREQMMRAGSLYKTDYFMSLQHIRSKLYSAVKCACMCSQVGIIP